MIVGRSAFYDTLAHLRAFPTLSLDTETTGLRPYHGDRLFSIILGVSSEQAYYFNWQIYGFPEYELGNEHLEVFKHFLSDTSRTWYLHNAKFDLAMLEQSGIDLGGMIHCTQAQARVEYNEHLKYSLEACAERIGYEKDSTVEKYIESAKLWEWQSIPGKKVRSKNKHYDQVPFDLIAPYGLIDAQITFALGQSQEKAFEQASQGIADGLPSLLVVSRNERKLIRTVASMERVGIKIDQEYCLRAARFEANRADGASLLFRERTGRDFVSSAATFKDVFSSERDLWSWTEKGNASFESSTLARFQNPAARHILEYRDAKSKSDFYHGFLYHADASHVVHPHFNPAGTSTGRFSSSEPNLQNLTNEENVASSEWSVRRAFIPRPGFIFVMLDYSAMEYRMMLDYACHEVGRLTPLTKLVLDGMDVHEATAQMATESGVPITRKQAKTVNFLTLYGGGNRKLAEGLGCMEGEASQIRQAIFRAAPEIEALISRVSGVVSFRKWIQNWLGRVYQFPDPRFSYKACNALIQGGCADVVKVAMNQIHDFLSGKRSRMLLTIHDEIVLEVHDTEIDFVPKAVQKIMETVYPAQYLPLTVGMEWSKTSLADKESGSFSHDGTEILFQTLWDALQIVRKEGEAHSQITGIFPNGDTFVVPAKNWEPLTCEKPDEARNEIQAEPGSSLPEVP